MMKLRSGELRVDTYYSKSDHFTGLLTTKWGEQFVVGYRAKTVACAYNVYEVDNGHVVKLFKLNLTKEGLMAETGILL